MTLSKITKPITDKDRDNKINGLIDEFESLAGVAITGSYNDLTNKPTIPDAQVQSNWNETDTSSKAYIKNKPTIPTVNNATLTIQKNGTTVKTFTANASSNVTCNITVPTDTQDLTNGAGYTANAVKSVNGTTPDANGDVTIGMPTVNNAKLTIQKNGSTVKTFTANASSDVTCNITVPTKTSDLINDEGYGKITGIKMNGSSKGSSGVVDLGTVITSHQDISGKANTADLSTVAFSGDYDDLSNKPTIPTVGNGTITINQGGTTKGTFTTNQSGNSTINLDVGGTTTDVKINNISITSSGVANIVTNTAYNSSTNKIATMSDLPAAQVQADWTVTNSSSKAYIKNKPTIPTVPTALSSFTDDLGSSPTHTHSQYLTSHQDISGKANTSLSNLNSTGNNLVNTALDTNDNTTRLKFWTGTKAQYDAITTKDSNTLYNITDDTDISLTLLQTIYPVGSVYLSTNSTCPLASLFGTWTLVSSGKALWTGTGSNGGSTIEAGLPNITGTLGLDYRDATTFTGAFSLGDSISQGFSNDNSGSIVNFNASNSNSIYGNSSTVQPPAYVVNVWRRTA